MKPLTRVFTGCAVLLAGSACTDLQSSDIKTSGMSARMAVSADGTGASTVSVSLNVDTSLTDYVKLSTGDSLVATVAGQSQTLAESNVLGVITYSSAFTGQDGLGAQYTVALKRGASDTSAPSSTATLPQPFTIAAPTASQTFSRIGADIAVTYSPSGQTDPVTWQVTGSCFNSSGATVTGDSGTFTIPRGSLTSLQGNGTPQNCQATLTISRTRPGTLDTAYYGGSISGSQQRSVQFTSTP